MERSQPPTTSDVARRSEKRSRTAHGILAAAMAIIAREGIVGLSMSALAKDVGISRQTLYKYFPDVDAVLMAMTDTGSAGLADLAAEMNAETDPREALRLFVTVVHGSIAAGHPSPQALAVALPARTRDAMKSHEAEAEELIIDLLRRGCEMHVFRADLDPLLDGRFIYRATFASAELALEPGVDTDLLRAHVTDDLIRMVESH